MTGSKIRGLQWKAQCHRRPLNPGRYSAGLKSRKYWAARWSYLVRWKLLWQHWYIGDYTVGSAR